MLSIDTDNNDNHDDDLCPCDDEKLFIVKTDDPNDYADDGADLADLITYTITIDPNEETKTNITVIDYLPLETEFVSAEPNDYYHDYADHWCSWDIDSINTTTEYTLTVRVTDAAPPGGSITNMVEIQLDDSQEYYYWDTHTTDITGWGGPIIYVDQNAQGYETGQSWQNALTDLQPALDLARNYSNNYQQIWVAQGDYTPGTTATDTFALEPNLALYGGFPTGGGNWNQRKPAI